MDTRYSETIAAISTAVSSSGIGIVRMTGEDAFEIADQVYIGKKHKKLINQKSHTIHYGYIEDEGKTIDEVLVMLMKGPHSYTGEDTVEINCHGGVYVVKKILETLIKYGARPAEPGEFTKRAYLNGRMDLSQAEAVGDIISSQNEYARQSSVSQLKGSIRKKIDEIRKQIIHHTAFIETALDDPEHISIDGYGDELKTVVDQLLGEIEYLLSTCESGRIIKEGINTVIVGKPNAGKSSLLNALLGEERAIVTDIAGTTRDILEENINLQGISLNIMDTAGIRNTDDVVEKIGVDKARANIEKADLILYVIDSSCPLDENDRDIFHMIMGKKSIILLNKSDLQAVVREEDVLNELNLAEKSRESIDCKTFDGKNTGIIEISAKNQNGINDLEEMLKKMFFEGNISFNNEIYITNVRHKAALNDAYQSLCKVNESIMMNMPEDFYSIDLMDAYESLGSITGETIGEDLVNEIFSKFCMGK
ncbi:MAG: tRNA uridine-5-carboxymethylaminomethyl(34) synthesis GTPase MnmE [Dorea sp.]|nr:tRNA uridine-5-carboxymethylaminomethyl(34) synthesis GTPase MnmE [Dorea sp.]